MRRSIAAHPFATLTLVALIAGCGKNVSEPQDDIPPGLSNKLVAWWNFEESGDSALDVSGNGHHLWSRGCIRTAGRSGQGISFDGAASTQAESNVVDGLALDTFTLVAWVKTPTSTHHQAIISRESDDGSISNYRLLVNGSDATTDVYQTGHVSLDGQSGSKFETGNVTVSKKRIDDDKWHLIVAIGAGNRSQIWIDGELDREDTIATRFQADPTWPRLGIGISLYNSGSYHFKGVLDEIRIYGRMLSPEEIKYLAQ